MSNSNHQKYLRKLNDEYELIHPIDNPITKNDVLRFKRYEYTTRSIERIGDRIKDNLNYSLITADIKRKYPIGHPRWKRELFGYCVPASFALLFFMDTDKLHPFTGSDPDGENHWWLEDVNSNRRFDLTSAQYSKKELEFVYSTGRPKKLYSFQGRPQSRFMDLMELVQSNTKRFIIFE